MTIFTTVLCFKHLTGPRLGLGLEVGWLDFWTSLPHFPAHPEGATNCLGFVSPTVSHSLPHPVSLSP
jgi:hypothetical protein